MNYLLDRKIKKKKFLKVLSLALILFFLIYFRAGIFNGLAYVSYAVLRPFILMEGNMREKISRTYSFFQSKNFLQKENENLKSQLDENSARISNYNSILDENIKMKEILGRKHAKTALTLAAILAKPNQSLYDTLVIDAGIKEGMKVGNMVFALGDVPIGRIAEVYASSKVILFSNPGEKTEVVLSGRNIFMQVIGRGGGNFEMILPRDFILDKGTEVVLPGLTPYVLAVVETIISDPRDSFQKALLVSPVNVQELKFVEVAQ